MAGQAIPLDGEVFSRPLPPTDEEANATGSYKPDADHEDAPFLPPDADPLVDAKGPWTPPRGFLWIEAAIMANVFLFGLDGTIMASTYAVISSEFDAANTASWLTTSYLVTSTAFQPLYGRFSDVFGRRPCFLVSSATFALGCLGCGLATDVVFLNAMRALTGFGGGGLLTLATIINSDMIPFQRRGMYQAMQNGFVGFGAVAGASLGGAVADLIGWRWCFLSQVPISVAALVLGWFVVRDPESSVSSGQGVSRLRTIWSKVDISGALVLVVAISMQLVALSLGGNELPWGSPWVVASLIGSSLLFALFISIQHRTTAIPVIPLRLLHGFLPTVTQLANVSLGLSAYAYIFMLPLFFQVVLGDSATKAGARLIIPSLALPLGGLVTGIVMSRWGSLIGLMRAGAIVMLIGNALTTSLQFVDQDWKYFVYIFPANLGQGMVMPAMLFTGLATFEHADHAVSASVTYLIRSLGAVWGVALTSAILQTTLSTRLPDALGGVENKEEMIDAIRHSITALKALPDGVQSQARMVYYEGIHNAFAASTAFAGFAVVMAFLANPRGLRRSLK
ncbi:vacuolar basic amino acid transporter 2 [Pyricularia oryzae 70-15]|uniref:Vacuolar basic amino acid transporter 2 n=1 Tax=Pyricularia oryzae (strain 70-15 / ATCC MYA-4617 / FGSC 8958) TaxID=242507 RepID=G4MZU3_PYRO7|nr:vacuolar basic amino acid transporter 2 [Pyricularia oryzae 70-15]EHA51387.1 vacuolar basic amino acid transporter 2 [Pyricularia oryzae 70-15]